MGQTSSKPSETTPADNDSTAQYKPDNTTLYVGIGLGVCVVLCICVVLLVFLMGGNDSDSGLRGSGSSFPEYLIIEHRYGDGVNPYNNLALPPLPPPKPDIFGANSE
ncbi:MAG: hypothetical protein EBU90_15035 [Proteobacteria bacterium]|nr:hypothetical protein [Pseudomonadota bacterium]